VLQVYRVLVDIIKEIGTCDICHLLFSDLSCSHFSGKDNLVSDPDILDALSVKVAQLHLRYHCGLFPVLTTRTCFHV